MPTSINGYPVIGPEARYDGPLPRLRQFVIPGANRILTLRDGAVGFLLAHFALWFHERVEKLDSKPAIDDGGWSYRTARGSSSWSNHASATAEDLNWNDHPFHKVGTFPKILTLRIRLRLALYRGCLQWGGNWRPENVDEMHVEVVKPLGPCERVARRLMKSPRGKRLLAANPGLEKVILS